MKFNIILNPMKNPLLRAAALFRAHTFKILLVAAVVVLAAANMSLLDRQTPRPVRVQAESVADEAVPAKEDSDIPTAKDEIMLPPNTSDSALLNLVHANCIDKLKYETEPSSVYKTGPYDMAFARGSSNAIIVDGLYDINGDNLPDYVYIRNWSGMGNEYADVHSESCIYLNNGAGWTKTYACLAITQKRIDNGQVTVGQYYGDCGQF